jgi:hypothetical protein
MKRASPSPALAVWLSIVAHGSLLAVVAGGLARAAPIEVRPDPNALTHAPMPGETFEVPVDDLAAERPTSEGTAAAEPTPPPAPADEAEGNDAPATAHSASHPHARPRAATPGTTSPSGTGTGDGDKPAMFGAAGDRSAVELASAFTRGFPQAASADPLWLAAPFGSAGAVDLTLTLDDTGALVATQSSGTPGAALAAGVRRTLALIRARSFVAEGKETHLRVTATVTRDEVHDGLHGEVFAIGGSFEGAGGNGFFALAVGRRIDIRVQRIK